MAHCCPQHHKPNINRIIHTCLTSSATDIRFIHGDQCKRGHYAISAAKKAIYCQAQELSVVHLGAEVDVPGRAPLQPRNDVCTNLVTDGELCD
jgi:hypothetical protein